MDVPTGQSYRFGWGGTNSTARLYEASGALSIYGGSSINFAIGNETTSTIPMAFTATALAATAVTANFGGLQISGSSVATTAYVDSVAQGLDAKVSVRASTTANITLSAPQTVDGVVLVAGDRVLVKNQTTASQNGLYLVAAGAWTRTTDMDAWAEVPGAFVFVEAGGATLANSGWVCNVAAGGTLGTTSITFTQFSSAGSYTASNGIALTGSNFALAGSPTITTGDLLVGAATAGQLASLADIATGNVLLSGGVGAAPSYGKVNLTAATHITGTLPVGNGGTGQTTALAGFDALVPTTTNGDITYRGATTSARLAGNTTGTKMFLNMTSSVPTWSALVSGDIPDLSSTYDTIGTTQTITGAKTFTPAVTLTGGFNAAATSKVGAGTAGAWGTPYLMAGNGAVPAAAGWSGAFGAAIVVDATNTIGTGFFSSSQVNGAASWVEHFYANNATITSGSLTNQVGFYAPDLTTATNNFGFMGNVSAGATKFNLHMAGDAKNYLNGELWGTKGYVYASSATVTIAREDSATLTTAATTLVNLDTFVAANFRSADYFVQVFDSVTGNIHATKLTLVRDNSNNVYLNEYGTLFNSAALATFDADYDGTSLIRLRVTPASANSTQFKLVRTSMAA
jgi:hypothetical protein